MSQARKARHLPWQATGGFDAKRTYLEVVSYVVRAIENASGRTLSAHDMVGTIRCLQIGSNKVKDIYRGFVGLDALYQSRFANTEFCLIRFYRFDEFGWHAWIQPRGEFLTIAHCGQVIDPSARGGWRLFPAEVHEFFSLEGRRPFQTVPHAMTMWDQETKWGGRIPQMLK